MLLEAPKIPDNVHKGPNQAGNKGLLSYNAALAVPGSTVFCPSAHSVILPTKNFEHTGRPVSKADREAALTGPRGTTKASEYQVSFDKTPKDTRPFSRTGGGYWITQSPPVESAPFTHTSTYRAEVLDGAQTAEKQLTRSLGLACTISHLEAARQTAPRAQTADSAMRSSLRSKSVSQLLANGTMSASRRPATAMTSTGEVVGYVTTNQAAFVANPLTNPVAPGAPRRHRDDPQPVEMRYQTLPHAMPPGMYGSASAYKRDFGEDGSDPMERSAPSERFQTRCSTSRDLAAGTTRNTNNPPGYTGHIAAYKYNALAQAQSAAADERLDRQADALLYSLDQYSRSRLPHYTGYKPKAACNITIVQPSQGPTKLTTSGAANLQGTRYNLTKSGSSPYAINSRAGIMTFFTSTGEYVSENGLSNAQSYYKLCEPGNQMKMDHFSHINHHGKKFNPRASMV